jgi:hypothetical protein
MYYSVIDVLAKAQNEKTQLHISSPRDMLESNAVVRQECSVVMLTGTVAAGVVHTKCVVPTWILSLHLVLISRN